MKQDADGDQERKITRCRGHDWIYESADAEQGAYSLSDQSGEKFVVVFPADLLVSIHTTEKKNALLFARAFGSEQWQQRGCFYLNEAMILGGKHADRYRAAEILRSPDDQGRSGECQREASKKDRDRDFER